MEWTPREVRAFWDEVKRIGLVYAIGAGLKGEYAQDCAQDFVTRKLQQRTDPLVEAKSEEAMETLRKQARSFARNRAYQFFHTSAKEVSLEELAEKETKEVKGFQRALICPAPGPEQLVIQAEFFARHLRAIDGLEAQQQALWMRHSLEGMRLVDLQEELGRNDNTLRQAIWSIRKRIGKLMAGEGMTSEEIAEYLCLFAKYRSHH